MAYTYIVHHCKFQVTQYHYYFKQNPRASLHAVLTTSRSESYILLGLYWVLNHGYVLETSVYQKKKQEEVYLGNLTVL